MASKFPQFSIQPSICGRPHLLQDLKDLLQTSWWQIPQHTFGGLTESMPQQIKASNSQIVARQTGNAFSPGNNMVGQIETCYQALEFSGSQYCHMFYIHIFIHDTVPFCCPVLLNIFLLSLYLVCLILIKKRFKKIINLKHMRRKMKNISIHVL